MQTQPAEMTTSTAVLEKLRKRHWDNEFVMDEKGFTPGNGKYYNPEDLSIIKTYRFEGPSDPGDSSIIYMIQTKDGFIGYSMDAYGVYSNNEGFDFDDFIKKIPVEERDEQVIFE
jgi:hypothetical protein